MLETPDFRPGAGIGMTINGVVRMTPRFARKFAALIAEIVRLAKFKVLPPLKLRDEDDGGRTIAIGLQPEMWAKLDGSSNPYSFTEQHYDSSTGFSDMVGARTGTNSYEANSVTGLGGNIVRLYYHGESDDWRFSRKVYTCLWFITVKGCGLSSLQGQTVELKQSGTTVASGTTNVSGQVTLDVPAGSYDIVVTDSAGYGYNTSTTSGVTHTCGQSTTVTMAVDSDHFCGNCGACKTLPKSVSITFTYAPGYTGYVYVDDVLVWDNVTSNWLGPWHSFPDSDPTAEYRLFLGCAGGLILGRQNAFSSHTSFTSGGVGTGAVTACLPFTGHGSLTLGGGADFDVI